MAHAETQQTLRVPGKERDIVWALAEHEEGFDCPAKHVEADAH